MNLLALAAAAALAAELPSLSEFRSALSELPAPATVRGVSAQGWPPAAAPLPARFKVRERVLSWTTTFDIMDDSRTYGVVAEKLLSLTRSFTYTDASGACVAQARQRLLSWGSHVDVTDCQGRAVGSIKEEVLKSLFKVHTTYAILDAGGRELAKSTKVDWIGTQVTLTAGGRTVAELKRAWLQWFRDTWEVQVVDPAAVDPRLIVMIGAYKTSVDNARRRESKDED